MDNYNDLNKVVRDRLDNLKFKTMNSIGRYQVVNDEGKVYSRFKGWQDYNMQIMGHQFQKAEVPVVLEILKEHGHTSSHVKKDSFGTLLHFVDSVSIKKENIGIYLTLTIAFFLTWYIVGNTGFVEALLSHLEKNFSATR